MSKFRKIAAGSGVPGIKGNLPKLNGKGFSGLIDLLNSDQNNLSNIFNANNTKRNLNYLAALMSGWTKDKYNSEAFQQALKTLGYEGTNASEGNFEQMSPDLMKQLEDFKKNPPSNLTDFVTKEPVKSLENESVPETSDRYKAMQEKLSSTDLSKQKFVKASATRKEQLKKIVPEWTIETVLSEMSQVAKNPRLSTAEKQKTMFDVINKYERSIAPLSDYLRKNGIQPK